MNLYDTIYVSLAAYSSIHPNRARVLDHLFCTNGNGYHWHKGQLISYDDDGTMTAAQRIAQIFDKRRESALAEEKWEAENKERREEKKRKKTESEKNADSDRIHQMVEKMMEARRKMQEADPEGFAAAEKKREEEWEATQARWAEDKRWEYCVPDDIEERMHATDWHNWYHMSEGYCKILNFPDNIQPDWLEGVIETANLVIAQPGVTAAYDRMNGAEVYQKLTKENVEAAKLALKRAEALLLKRGEYSPTGVEFLRKSGV